MQTASFALGVTYVGGESREELVALQRVKATAARSVRLFDWLGELEANEPRAYQKCLAVLLELAEKGNELRRPVSDALDGGVRELRARVGTFHYRILYFFCGRHIVCLSHGFTEEGKVPARDIEVALRRKQQVTKDPDVHTADFE